MELHAIAETLIRDRKCLLGLPKNCDVKMGSQSKQGWEPALKSVSTYTEIMSLHDSVYLE